MEIPIGGFDQRVEPGVGRWHDGQWDERDGQERGEWTGNIGKYLAHSSIPMVLRVASSKLRLRKDERVSAEYETGMKEDVRYSGYARRIDNHPTPSSVREQP